ncbi:hypothetical protein NHX12_010257 [Muraenolepis orangiensis]|uniref:Uncharacterized protein n=1 Tax=Muraenolepis orangiensis TaxID=630683 RepID=A0A9Q0DMR6_9TELE|nr:hypothetical protein NHX12_010257 [Muraenolepis orangiensis]
MSSHRVVPLPAGRVSGPGCLQELSGDRGPGERGRGGLLFLTRDLGESFSPPVGEQRFNPLLVPEPAGEPRAEPEMRLRGLVLPGGPTRTWILLNSVCQS